LATESAICSGCFIYVCGLPCDAPNVSNGTRVHSLTCRRFVVIIDRLRAVGAVFFVCFSSANVVHSVPRGSASKVTDAVCLVSFFRRRNPNVISLARRFSYGMDCLKTFSTVSAFTAAFYNVTIRIRPWPGIH